MKRKIEVSTTIYLNICVPLTLHEEQQRDDTPLVHVNQPQHENSETADNDSNDGYANNQNINNNRGIRVTCINIHNKFLSIY